MILAVPEPTPGWLVVGLNDRDAKMHDVYRLEIATGKRELVFKNEANIIGWDVDLTGKLRLGQRMTSDGGMEILRIDGQKLTSVYTCNQEESCGAVRFHKDGKRVYMITNKGRTDLSRLVLFDPAAKEEVVVESDPEKQVDFGGAEFSDVTEELVATTYEADRLRIYPHEDQFRHDYELVRKALPDGDLHFGSATEDERLRLVTITSDVDPGATYLYDRSTGAVELLYRPRPKLPTQHLAPMRAVRYNARDGNIIPAYLTVPKGSGGNNLPAIVLPHGGPWARDTWGYNSFAQFLANRGYAVLQPNFRGSTGYGKKFLNLGNKQWGTGFMQHDLTDGVSWLIEQGITKPKRVAIMGGSYGGFATLAGVTFTPDLYAAGVDIVGPSSIPTLLASIPPYWAPMKKLFSVRVGDPDDPAELAKLKAQSPLYSAKKIKAPLLVIQGANDPRVKQAESDQIVAALRDAGRPVEYLVAPDEGHGFRGQENRIAMFAGIERFLAKHLGGRHQQSMTAPVAQKLAAITVDVKKVTAKSADPGNAASPTAAGAVAAPLVPATFTGASLQPAKLRYAFKGETLGRPIEGTSTLTIAGGKRDRRAVWTIAEQSKTSQGNGSDTTVLDKETLLPLDRKVRQGATTLDSGIFQHRGQRQVESGRPGDADLRQTGWRRAGRRNAAASGAGHVAAQARVRVADPQLRGVGGQGAGQPHRGQGDRTSDDPGGQLLGLPGGDRPRGCRSGFVHGLGRTGQSAPRGEMGADHAGHGGRRETQRRTAGRGQIREEGCRHRRGGIGQRGGRAALRLVSVRIAWAISALISASARAWAATRASTPGPAGTCTNERPVRSSGNPGRCRLHSASTVAPWSRADSKRCTSTRSCSAGAEPRLSSDTTRACGRAPDSWATRARVNSLASGSAHRCWLASTSCVSERRSTIWGRSTVSGIDTGPTAIAGPPPRVLVAAVGALTKV